MSIKDQIDSKITVITKEAETLQAEVEENVIEGKSWLKEHWYIPTCILAAIVGISVFWAVIQ